MDSGKALARCGELLIDLTTSLNLYGGALSAVGANIRNAGDCVAQAAASCRFKTGTELVCDELREAATCLTEAATKLNEAVAEAVEDGQPDFGKRIGTYRLSSIVYCYFVLYRLLYCIVIRIVVIRDGLRLCTRTHAHFLIRIHSKLPCEYPNTLIP